MNKVTSIIAALALGLSASACGSTGAVEKDDSPQVVNKDYYNASAQDAAKRMDCKNFKSNGGGEGYKDSGVCFLDGSRVNVITFTDARQQAEWSLTAEIFLPKGESRAEGEGAVVVAKDGNKVAATKGAEALPGDVVTVE